VHVLDLAAKGKHGAGGARAFPRFLAELLVRCRVAGDAETSRDVAGRTGNVSFGGGRAPASRVFRGVRHPRRYCGLARTPAGGHAQVPPRDPLPAVRGTH
jgi:hypothetical protein